MSGIDSLSTATTNLSSSNLTWVPNLLDELRDNQNEIDLFTLDPEGYIRGKGYDLPEGFHVHYIDQRGDYFPSEPNRKPNDQGTRLEARIDHGET